MNLRSVHLSDAHLKLKRRSVLVGRDENERQRERGEQRALRQDRRARGTSAHRPGQGAARMEIRPDRFKAAAGKTLGKINRCAFILNYL